MSDISSSMNRAPKVLVVDDDDLSARLVRGLEEVGVGVQRAYNRAQARALLRSLRFDVVVSEVALPGAEGEELLQEALPFAKSAPFIFTVRETRLEQAVEAIRAGALDFIEKPYDPATLTKRIVDIIESKRARDRGSERVEPLARSAPMGVVVEQIRRIANLNVPVLFVGERGSGKETLARCLHRRSPRSGAPFVEVRCETLGVSSASRVLFGDPPDGRKEGTVRGVLGALERAREGFLYLNRVEELPPSAQIELIEALETDNCNRPHEGEGRAPFRARLVASSALPGDELRRRVDSELMYRLGVVEIAVPPLRNRQEDIEALISGMIEECAAELGCEALPLDAEASSAARLHVWPGNFSEMRMRVLRSLSLPSGKVITAADMFPEASAGASVKRVARNLDEARAAAEKDQILQALAATDGRVGDAARRLGISRVTLWMKMKRLGLQPVPDQASADLMDKGEGGMGLTADRPAAVASSLQMKRE